MTYRAHGNRLVHSLPAVLCVLAAAILALSSCQSLSGGRAAGDPEALAAFHEKGKPFLAEHCFPCHNAERHKADIDLETAANAEMAFEDSALWNKVVAMISTGDMPPDNRPQPDAEAAKEMAALVQAALEYQVAAIEPDPGRVTVRRLNRAEYNNTVRDLLGVDFQPAADFPPDDSGYGFDTIGDVLSLSPLLAEKYLDAAERIAEEVVARETVPLDTEEPPARYVFVCDHASEAHGPRCAGNLLKPLARRAYRRPVNQAEADGLVQFVQTALENDDSFYDGIALALQAMLVSPHFLFRTEVDRALTQPKGYFRVSQVELASRLSYFLWSSMPDEELLTLAERGRLFNPRTLRGQVRRMLRDPKSGALAEHFGGQWLEFRNLTLADPDPELFPAFDDALRESMAQETELFFKAIVQEDRSILEFIDADFTYVNETLANLYEMDGISGEAFQRVSVDRDKRGGVLTQASVLTVSSYPTRTSPVIRGLWVLSNILASRPPPPPADVPPLEDAKADKNATVRARLEAHRENPSCAVCHDRIDPLGFGLENYDAIGAWRTMDGETPIDNSGTLPGGETFAGPAELKQIILERKEEFARCLTGKMLTYGLGRGLEPYDEPVVDRIVERLDREDYRFSALVYEIVRSLPFQQRRAEPEVS